MIPNATQQRAEALFKMYAEAEEELIAILASRVGRVGQDPPQWAQQKLKQVQAVRAELKTAIDGLASRSLEERIKLMWAAHDEGADGLLRELGIEGVVSSARSQSAVTLIDDYNERFSELHRRILRDAADAYRSVLNQALPMATMGVETTQQAIRRALNAFADRGITAFVDKAGRRWGMAEYAEMATRTGLMNAALAGYTQEALNHSEDLVIVTDHADECPLCAPWERRVLSLTGAQLSHPDCSGTIADARAAGLFHPNCLHGMTVYVPGLTVADGNKPSGSYYGSDDQRGYQQRQLQRYYERTVRRWKRRQAAATTPEDERIAKAYVDKWQRKLRELIGDNPKLPRKYSREGGRVLLSEAAKKMRALQVSENGGIISAEAKRIIETRELIRSKAINKAINPEKQSRHIKDSPLYDGKRSYIYGDISDAQKLVDMHHGMGEPVFDRNGKWKNKELAVADVDIGVNVNPEDGSETPTNRFVIHYSKTGSHIVPTARKE